MHIREWIKKSISVALVAGMLITGMPAGLHAEENHEDATKVIKVDTELDNNADSEEKSNEDKITNVIPIEDKTNQNVDISYDNDADEEALDNAEQLEEDSDSNALEDKFIEDVEETDILMDLTSEQMKEKELISEDIDVFEEASAGTDYVSDELLLGCQSEEEAVEVAKKYSQELGADIEVKEYAYGVATLTINNAEDTDEVIEDAMKIALDVTNDFPAVYPNYYEELCSVDDKGTYTANESFTDPFTKDSYEEYQWFHEVINDKYVWAEMEKLYAEGSSYEGPLNPDFIANLTGMTVAVIDSGIVKGHEDFKVDASSIPIMDSGSRSSVIIAGVDASVTSIGDDYEDHNGHGSNVAGIIANVANDKGGRGVAAGVNILPIKVTDGTGGTIKSASSVRALNYVADNAEVYNIRVVNLSIGGTGYSTLYRQAIEAVIDKGIVVCAAAGNYNSTMDFYPSGYAGTIDVASVNSAKQKSMFSNYGKNVVVAAPGGEGRTILYNSKAVSVSEYSYASKYGTIDGYEGMRGTSQATPVASAVAAMILANNPGLTPNQVRDILTSTATKNTDGYTIGAGCIDVAKALGIELVNKPIANIESGVIPDECNVKLSIYDNAELDAKYEGKVYFTLDGTVPNIYDAEEDAGKAPEDMVGSTYIYDFTDPLDIVLRYDGVTKLVTLKARALLYGNLSDVAVYNYSFDTEKVRTIDICSKTGMNIAAVGKTIQLIADVKPTYAKNKNVSWSSSDTSIATVDSKGLVSVRARSNTPDVPVTITATALDGSDVSATFDIYVPTRATNVEIDLPQASETVKLYDANTVLLYVNEGDTYDLGANPSDPMNIDDDVDRKWHVWPKSAQQEVIFTSSNNKVATVSEDGVIHAVKSGTAVISVVAADGSKAKDTIKVKCETSISRMEIIDSTGKDYIAAGQKLTPIVTFNDGKSVPDNKNLKWEVLGDGADYVTINAKTGVVTAKSNSYIERKKLVTISAYSESYDIGDTYDFMVYPITTSIAVNTDLLTNNCYIMALNSSKSSFSNLVGKVEPVGTLNRYSYKSSNPKVLQIDAESGRAVALANGTAKVTITALDGSKKSVSFNVKVIGKINKLGLANQSGTVAIYPGKKLNFTAKASNGYEFASGDVEWKLSDSIMDDDDKPSDYDESKYLTVKNGVVSVKDAAKTLTRKYEGELQISVVVDGTTYTAASAIEVYPTGTSKIVLGESSILLDDIGDSEHGVYKLQVSSEPELSYNRGFTYKTSNAKVATVGIDGVVRATGNGTAYITVYSGDNSGKSAKCEVTVAQKPTSVTVLQAKGLDTLGAGKNLTLTAKVNARNGEYPAANSTIKWSIPNEDDRNYVTVNNKGVVTAKRDIFATRNVVIRATSAVDEDVYAEYYIDLYPAVTSISLTTQDVTLRTPITERMTPLADDYPEYCDFAIAGITPANASNAVTVRSLNEKVAKVIMVDKESADDSDLWRIIPVGKGSTQIRVTAADGSGKYADVKVKVICPVTNLAVVSKNGSYNVKPGGSLGLKVTMDAGASNTGVTYAFTEPNTMRQYASINPSTGVLTAKKASVIGTASPIVSVYAKAKDVWGDESEPIYIRILPGVILMENLRVKSSTGRYDLSAGSSLTMQATTTTDATDKSITWYVVDVDDGGIESDTSEYATITTGGILKAKSNIVASHTVRVYAKAKDAGAVTGYKDVTLYPKTKSWSIDSSPVGNIHSIRVGEELALSVDTQSAEGCTSPCAKYYVTYTTGSAKVYLQNVDNGNGTYVKVYGLAKGYTIVTFEAMDGTNKKKTYRVNITQ